MGGSHKQDCLRHRQQGVHVERAGQPLSDQSGGARLTNFDLFAELPGQNAATFHCQISPAGWLRHSAGKNFFLDGGEVELPGRDPGSACRHSERVHDRDRPTDGQVMEPPVRHILGYADRDRCGRPAAPPFGSRGRYFQIRRRRDGRDREDPRGSAGRRSQVELGDGAFPY